MDFDEDRIFFSHQNLQQQNEPTETEIATANDVDGPFEEGDLSAVNTDALRRHFREFLREFAFISFTASRPQLTTL